jgi:hypothetical protein
MTMTQLPAPAFGAPPTPVTPAPPAPAPVLVPRPAVDPATTMAVMVDKYRQLRDKKKEISDRHTAELAPLNEVIGQLYVAILDALNRAGADSIKTPAGTAYKSIRRSYTVKDPAQFREWLEQMHRFDLLTNAVSKEAIDKYVEEGNNLPPGLGVSSEVTLGVRK